LQCQTPAAETQPTATGGEEKARRASVTGYTVTCSGTRRELFQTAFAVRALLPRLLESQLRICKSTQLEPQQSGMDAPNCEARMPAAFSTWELMRTRKNGMVNTMMGTVF
jgi:hypothetical protein